VHILSSGKRVDHWRQIYYRRRRGLRLLKRGLKGTYIAVEPFHLFRYLDEQAFRYNERKNDDGGRFLEVLNGLVGRRLTYQKLTGKDEAIIPS
jgi:hypothetical protein